MKRSASSASKENAIKACFNKHSGQHTRTYEEQIKLLCTQSLVPDYQGRESYTWKTPLPEFNRTFGNNNFTEISRPESKQAFRKCLGRPETSKGIRPCERNVKVWQPQTRNGYQSQYVVDRKRLQQQQQEGATNANIEIIVTQSSKRLREKKNHRSKFETDLDDQFLQLFAN